MPKADKVAAVAEISERFTTSTAAVITEYRGLTVKQVTELRRALGRDTTYAVVKNTLTRRAAAEAGVAIDNELLVGPTAIAFVAGDPVAATKGLRDFAKANPVLVIKGGILEGKLLTASEVNQIAGALKALPTRAAGLFQAPLSQMARLAKALEEKKPAEAGTAPAADAAPADAPADAPAADASAEAPVAEASAPAAPADDASSTEASAEPAE